jgi:enoyl-CoA hydratase/carnithine racemase
MVERSHSTPTQKDGAPSNVPSVIEVTDSDGVRLVRLNRPGSKNAMNEALWDATTEAFIDAASNASVAVVVLTGSGDSFSAGQDIGEMALGATGGLQRGKHGFQGLAAQLASFPKPFLCAVNGIGVGFGATVVGLADLVFMSATARLKCPFTSLGIGPELGSSFTFPQLVGRQHGFWALLSSEWLSAEECKNMGLVFQVCAPSELMETTMRHARILADRPIGSLVESKRLILDAMGDQITAAVDRENSVLKTLVGSPDNIEALRAFVDKRRPNFSSPMEETNG